MSARSGSLALMLAAVALFTGMAALVKVAREAGMSTSEVMLWRMAPGIGVVALQMTRRGISWRPHRPGPVLLRSITGGLAMAMYFWALQELTLLQFSVIGLSQPVFVAMVAVPLLHERLRGSAMLALLVALGGAVLVVLPDAIVWRGDLSALEGVPLAAAMGALGSALASAVAHTLVRRATGPVDPQGRPADAPQTVVLHFSVLVSLGALAVGLLRGELHGPPASMSTGHALVVLLSMSALGVLGQLAMSTAYARGNAPATAILGYARMPMGWLLDVVVWSAVAESSGLAGAVLVFVAGGLLVRDRGRTGRARPPPAPRQERPPRWRHPT